MYFVLRLVSIFVSASSQLEQTGASFLSFGLQQRKNSEQNVKSIIFVYLLKNILSDIIELYNI